MKVDVKLGDRFLLGDGSIGKVTEVHSLGFNYHTMNSAGDCIKPQQYKLKKDHFIAAI